MGKTDEFEQKIIKQGMTDADFVKYEKLLKRVRGNFSKRQLGKLYNILARHKYYESLNTTPEAAAFIKNFKI